MSSVVVIANPAAAGGAARRAFERLRPRLNVWAPGCRVRWTSSPGHAETLAEQARRDGAELVVVAGGDGTLHETVNGLLKAGTNGLPDLACLPLGTGCDLARSVNLAAAEDALEVPLSRYQRLSLDVGVAELSSCGKGERRTSVYFINDANAGLGSVVADRLSGSTTLRRFGAAAYVLAAVPALVRGARTEFLWDGDAGSGRAALLNVSICNGPSFGGGMRPCPQARHDDGFLHMALIDAIPVSRIPGLLLKAVRGGSLVDPAIRVSRGRHLTLQGDALVETDGEVRGRLPGRFSVLPGALTLRVPPAD